MDKFSQGPNFGSMQNRERKGLNYTLCQLNIFLLNSVVKVEFQISDSWNLGREGINTNSGILYKIFFFFFFKRAFFFFFFFLFIYFWLCWVFGSCEGFL